jgi:hypothetical protein
MRKTRRTIRAGLLSVCLGLLTGGVAWSQTNPAPAPEDGVSTDTPLNYMVWGNGVARAGIGYNGTTEGSWHFRTERANPATPLDDDVAIIQDAAAYLFIPDGDTGQEVEVGRQGNFLARPTTNYKPNTGYHFQTGGFIWRSDDDNQVYTVEFKMKLVRDVLTWEYTVTNENTSTRRIGFRWVENIEYVAYDAAATTANKYRVAKGGDYVLPIRGRFKTSQILANPTLINKLTTSQYNLRRLFPASTPAIPSDWYLSYTPTGVDPGSVPSPALFQARQITVPNPTTDQQPALVIFGTEEQLDTFGWDTIYEASLQENITEPLDIQAGSSLAQSLAVGYYFAPESIPARSSRTYRGQFQLNWTQVATFNDYALSLGVPESMQYRNGDNPFTSMVTEAGYLSPDEFDVRAYVCNSTLLTKPNASVSIDLGEGLQLVAGQPTSFQYPQLGYLKDQLVGATAENTRYSWRVRATGTRSGLLPIRVTATFAPAGSLTKTVYINVPTLPARSYMRGTHFLGFPFEFPDANPSHLVSEGSGVQLAWWDPSQKSYRNASANEFQLQAGRGYWMKFPTDMTFPLPAGVLQIDGTSPYGVSLSTGWNAIANPYQFAITWGKCRVNYLGQEFTVEEAIARAFILPRLWSWDTEIGDYVQTAELATDIKPGTGYWIYVVNPLTLVFAPNEFQATTRSLSLPAAGRQAGTASNWRINLLVETPTARDRFTTFGVAESSEAAASRAAPEPPMSPLGLAAYFVRAARTRGFTQLAEDVQAPASQQSWTLEVACTHPQQRVTLRWPDLTQAPPGTPILLTDQLTGQQLSLRTAPEYSYSSGDGGVRRFTVTVGGSHTRLRFVQATNDSTTRGAGVRVTYSLTTPAAVTARFRTPTGRLIRQLTPTRATGGLTTAQWDGRDAQGTLAPAGRYICELFAEDSQGQRARATLLVTVP